MEQNPDTRVWSVQQERIKQAFRERKNFVVVARAGCGKTTILMEGMGRCSPFPRRLVTAFSRIIADELNKRIRLENFSGMEAKTLHGIGYRFIMPNWRGVQARFDSERADLLAQKVCGPTVPDAVWKLVSKLHTKGREMAPHATDLGELVDLALQFELEPDDELADKGYDLTYVERRALDAMDLAARVRPENNLIDGSDMIFLPLRNRWLRPTWDDVAVDEAQDMTTAQLEVAQGVCKGRIAVIGDPCQAIFGFRGADSNSLYRLKQELNAEEFPLTVTYRCAQVIVRAAQEYVPDFTAAPTNPEGEISEMPVSRLVQEATAGDFVLSRANAPLISIAMSLLKAGKRTMIAGKDVGDGLVKLVNKLKAKSLPDFMQKIARWEERERDKAIKRYGNRPAMLENSQNMIRDKAEMLTALAEDVVSVSELISKIEMLFAKSDNIPQSAYIICSSVHKAKGLEADRVFILADTLRTHTQEEMNITYVAITRAKSKLVYVWPIAENEEPCSTCGGSSLDEGVTCTICNGKGLMP